VLELSVVSDRNSWLFVKRHRFKRVAPIREHGMRVECGRCGEYTRVPTRDIQAMSTLPLCASCVSDDRDAATRGCPKPRLFGQSLNMYAWWNPVPPEPEVIEVVGVVGEDLW
jgi:hypothetical protein